MTTPDLRGKFVMGAGDEHPAGATGGSETHEHALTINGTTLSVSQMPSHAHTVYWSWDSGYTYNRSGGANQGGAASSYAGGSGSHDHTGSAAEASSLPPYYTLAYIMKL